MIKKIAWDTFKNTGDINAFLELKQIENIENKMNNSKDIEDIQNIMNISLDRKNKRMDKI